MNVVTICGSAGRGNYTQKALALLQDELKQLKDINLIAIEPSQLELGIPGLSSNTNDSKTLTETINKADGVILSTPEYHGSFSALLKLAIENMGFPSALKSKPVALLGVAAGRIGAIKSLEHLRSVCSHVGAMVMPMAVSVANVRVVFDKDGNCLDANVEKQVRGLAIDLVKYIYESRCQKLSFEEWVRQSKKE